MQYETSIERLAREKGYREGYREGYAYMLKIQLEIRFGKIPEWAAQKIEEAPIEALEIWVLRILEARSVEEFFA